MITSSHNPRLQLVRALNHRRTERDQSGQFVIEGVRLVEEALATGWTPDMVLFSQALSDRGRALLDGLRAAGAATEEVLPALLDATSDTGTSQGILAVLAARVLPLPNNLDFILVADAVRDPGNLGTLLRSAAAAGAQAIFCAPGTTDPFSPKVLRAGMGAHFRLPVLNLTWPEIQVRCNQVTPPLNIYLADAEQGQSLWVLDLRAPLALVVGGEAEGASAGAHAAADVHVSIPMPGHFESLNAAVAASILLFEVVRQRTASSQRSQV
jgi:TrmH family RNA methyltransferase